MILRYLANSIPELCPLIICKMMFLLVSMGVSDIWWWATTDIFIGFNGGFWYLMVSNYRCFYWFQWRFLISDGEQLQIFSLVAMEVSDIWWWATTCSPEALFSPSCSITSKFDKCKQSYHFISTLILCGKCYFCHTIILCWLWHCYKSRTTKNNYVMGVGANY